LKRVFWSDRGNSHLQHDARRTEASKRDEQEHRFGIDEATDEPGTGDAIDFRLSASPTPTPSPSNAKGSNATRSPIVVSGINCVPRKIKQQMIQTLLPEATKLPQII
jgi:hypothetical protein